MVIKKNNRCIKMLLPNNKVVDILSVVFDEIYKWIQAESDNPESGGFIVGYEHKNSGNISLEDVSHPYALDPKNQVRFNIVDPRHKAFLKKASRKKSYYMGTWHTHPQTVPVPSSIDWEDWHASMLLDRAGSQFMFFVIAGTEEVRVWVGDSESGEINEIFEVEKDEEGLYIEKAKEKENKFF